MPREERERLVGELLESLNKRAAAEFDPTWTTEIERHLVAYDRGEVQALPAEEVLVEAHTVAK